MGVLYIRGCREQQISVISTEHQALTESVSGACFCVWHTVVVHPSVVPQFLFPPLPCSVVASVVKAADVVIIYLLTH